MSKFKKGDKVQIVSSQLPTYWYANLVGKIYTLKNFNGEDWYVEECDTGVLVPADLYLVEEAKPTFDLKTQPWFIRINSPEESKVVQEWLFSNGIVWGGGCFEARNLWAQYLTNIDVDGEIRGVIMWCHEDIGIHESAKELKFNFKSVIDSVEYPEYETETQKQLKELEQTIKKAQEQIAQLKEM